MLSFLLCVSISSHKHQSQCCLGFSQWNMDSRSITVQLKFSSHFTSCGVPIWLQEQFTWIAKCSEPRMNYIWNTKNPKQYWELENLKGNKNWRSATKIKEARNSWKECPKIKVSGSDYKNSSLELQNVLNPGWFTFRIQKNPNIIENLRI